MAVQQRRGGTLWTRTLIVSLVIAVAALVTLPVALAGEPPLRVVHPAIGARSTAVYQAPCGDIAVIDAGPGTATRVLEWLDRLGGRSHLRWIAATNYRHVADIPEIARANGVTLDAVYDRGGSIKGLEIDGADDYHTFVSANGLRTAVADGDVIELCPGDQPVTFTVVEPDSRLSAGSPADANERDRSLCFHAEHGAFDAASCGDLGGRDGDGRIDLESAVSQRLGDVEVVTVSEHGAATSSNETFVSATSPEVAVVQVGRNAAEHPSLEILQRWSATADVLQTQSREDGSLLAGTVTIETDGRGDFRAVASALPYDVRYELDETAPAEADASEPDAATDDDGCVAWDPAAERSSRSTDLPARVVSRAEFAACVRVLVEQSGGELPSAELDYFTDDDGRVGEDLLNRLAEAGILSGIADQRYRPDDPLVRGQMATVLVRSLEFLSGNDLAANTDYFVDDSLSFHQANINRAAEAGVTWPGRRGTFEPHGLVTRLEAATSLRRALELSQQGP